MSFAKVFIVLLSCSVVFAGCKKSLEEKNREIQHENSLADEQERTDDYLQGKYQVDVRDNGTEITSAPIVDRSKAGPLDIQSHLQKSLQLGSEIVALIEADKVVNFGRKDLPWFQRKFSITKFYLRAIDKELKKIELVEVLPNCRVFADFKKTTS